MWGHISYFKMLFAVVIGLGLTAPVARANNTQTNVDGSCQAPQATAPMTCAQLSEASNIAQQVSHPIIKQVRGMERIAHRRLAEDGTRLRTHFLDLLREDPNQAVNRLRALETELPQLKIRVCEASRVQPTPRNEADCEQVTAALNHYNTLVKPTLEFATNLAHVSIGVVSDPEALNRIVTNLTRVLSCENTSGLSTAADNERQVHPDCAYGRLILLQAAPRATRRQLWRRLRYRHTTESNDNIANNGYTLGGGRLGERAVGDTTDCSDFACRAITGQSRSGCPDTSDYMAIGNYLSHSAATTAPVIPHFPGLHQCFDRVNLANSNPAPGDIIVYPSSRGGRHMLFVNGFDASTGMVHTLEAAGTNHGIVSAQRRLEAYEPPTYCSNATPNQLEPIPDSGYHILRLRDNPGQDCPRSVRDQIERLNRAP